MTILRVPIIVVVFMLVSGCISVFQAKNVEHGRVLIEHQGVHGTESSWCYIIESEEEFCRLDFLFGELGRIITKEYREKHKEQVVPFYPGSRFGKEFCIHFYDSKGIEKGISIIIGSCICAPLVGRGERRDGCAFSAQEGKLVYELMLRLELIFLGSPYAETHSLVSECGLSINGTSWSEAMLEWTREDFERAQISDVSYMAENAETKEEKDYWMRLLSFYKTKMLVGKSPSNESSSQEP